MECENKNLPDLPEAAMTEYDLLTRDTLLDFGNFYASTHPESMAGVDEMWNAILGSFICPSPIRYES